MAITKTWSITDLERETSDNYVCYVHWVLTGTEDGKTVQTDGRTFLDRPSTLVDYATLTEEIVLGWVKAKINADSWIGSDGGHAAIVSKMYHHLHPQYPAAADGYELGIHQPGPGYPNAGVNGFQMGIMTTSGNHYLQYYDPSYVTGQWYNVVATFDNGLAKLYVNGILKATNTYTGNIDISPTNLVFGGRADLVSNSLYSSYGAALFDGKIDEVSMWNVALDDSQILNIQNCSPNGSENGLIGYWNFEEGTGTTANDLSSFSNNGFVNQGQYINDAAFQSCNLTSVNGCDSTAFLHLTIVPCYGCTDSTATNYDSTATIDDGSCTYLTSGCYGRVDVI